MGAFLARVMQRDDMGASLDVWHFICDDADHTWTWRRMSPDGEHVSASDFCFKSFNVCVTDAKRAGYLSNVTPYRRIRSSELAASDREIHRRRSVERPRGKAHTPRSSPKR